MSKRNQKGGSFLRQPGEGEQSLATRGVNTYRLGKSALTIYLNENAWEAVHQLSGAMRCSKTALVLEALDDMFEKHQLGRLNEETRARRGSGR